MAEKINCSVKSASFILNAVETAEIVGVDSMLFRPGLVSGIGGKTGMSVVMLHEHDEDLDFDVLGVQMPKDLKVRFGLVEIKPDAIELDTIQERIDDDPTQRTVITGMTLKNGRMKVTYTAGSPKAIRAPRRISFNELHTITVSSTIVHASLLNAQRALSTDADTVVALSAYKGDLKITIQDKNNDVYEDVVATLDSDIAFSHRYFLSYFSSLIKAHQEGVAISISKEGLLKFTINKLSIYQFPKV